ncbi:MAG: glycosyl transferase [Bacteroidetes bacterium HGW-Bacteroidetes-22]|nr:MAG: glycosyl transferase [Bacteroidetes bacterium HGW-Bacteroidetes-22]
MKRIVDLTLSLLALPLVIPVMCIVSLMILLTSRGGVFFRQKRVGRFNKDFTILKFRTMYKGSDRQGLLTIGGRDRRVTPVGYWLRRYKLDELPQVFNVIGGTMSLVGPRPEVRMYVEHYTPLQRQVLDVKPGVTDPASIEYINENELLEASVDPVRTYLEVVMPRKLSINLLYIQSATWRSDLLVIFRTVMAIFN